MEQAADEENQQPSQDPEAQNFEAQDSLEAQSSRPVHNTGWLKYIVDCVLGDHYSDSIWQLRLLATFIFVALTMSGSFFLPIYLHVVHVTYQRVMAITIVGAPVVVAVISLFVSFWLPSERTNWITGLLVVNISILGGASCLFGATKWNWTLAKIHVK